MKHTPGPWKVEQGTYPHEGFTVITATHSGMNTRSPLAMLHNVAGFNECSSDARLIAAAPALLAALKLAAEIIGHPDDYLSQLIAETIRKAESP